MTFSQHTRYLVLSAIGFLAGFATPEFHYRDLFPPLTRMGVSPDQLQAFPVFLVHPETKTPAPRTRLILDTSPEPTV